jgi:tetratricopeptide (TPR) repeat protein
LPLARRGKLAVRRRELIFVSILAAGFFPGGIVAQSAGTSGEAVLQSQQIEKRDSLLNRGFDLLKQGDRAGALNQFRAARDLDPANLLTLKQIGFLELENGNLKKAVASFEAAHAIAPHDYYLALQLGYLYQRLDDYAKVEKAFREAAASPDEKIRTDAGNALQNILHERKTWFFDLYGSPMYTSRFHNGIAIVQSRLGWKPSPETPLSLYLGGQVTRDTDSKGGTLPIIFSDDVGLLGLGILLQPKQSHFALRAEENLAVPLIGGGTYNYGARGDFRVIGSYYNFFPGALRGPLDLITLDRLRSERLFSDLDASAGYYSRYHHNGILYLQNREGLRLVSMGSSQLSGYLKYFVVKDTHRDFYNNLAEGGGGIEFRPVKKVNLGLRAEFLRGSYFGIARQPNPYRPNYNDVRVVLVFGKRF